MSNLCEQLLENDLNPFMTFKENGKLNKFNKAAEFLFNFVSVKELYQLAVHNASKSYGFEHKYMGVQYKKQSFYALLVGYINDDEIALKLYKEVKVAKKIDINKKYNIANIFSLISISKNSVFINDIEIKEIYDVSIPEFKIQINEFLLTLNSIFEIFKNENFIQLKTYIKIGEYEIINNKKYPLMCLEIKSNNNIDLQNTNISKDINIYYNGNYVEIYLAIIV